MSWFTKKPKAAPVAQAEPAEPAGGAAPPQLAPVEGGQRSPVIQRWDAAIADIVRRFDGVLAQATAASQQVLASLELDLEPLSRIWSPAEHQMHQHTEEVSEKWNEISDQLSESAAGEETMLREGGKRDLATCEMELRYQRAYRALMARAAELLREKGLASAAPGRRCIQCAAPLTDVMAVSQAVNVQCPACGATTVVDPGPALRAFAASGALFIGQRAAQASWEAMRRAETLIHNYRDKRAVPVSLLRELESSAREYWTTTLTVEAEHVPEIRQHVAAKVESYMKGVQKTLRQFWQWPKS